MQKKYEIKETVWWLTKRFLRTVVPQIPALMSSFEVFVPKEYAPFLVALGGLLTVIDKLFRDKGYYDTVISKV